VRYGPFTRIAVESLRVAANMLSSTRLGDCKDTSSLAPANRSGWNLGYLGKVAHKVRQYLCCQLESVSGEGAVMAAEAVIVVDAVPTADDRQSQFLCYVWSIGQ
jgi:hypothetical protein